jgi:transposase
MTREQVVAAYHDLYQVERSFRMTKTDLAARPVFHRLRDSIEAHLTVVFAALAVSREAQARTGLSINKILKLLRPLRTATITLGTLSGARTRPWRLTSGFRPRPRTR